MGLEIYIDDYARQGWDLPLSYYRSKYYKVVISTAWVSALALFFSKMSVLLLYVRLFTPTRKLRALIYFGILWTILINFTSIIVVAALCAPRQHESLSSLSSIQRCGQLQAWAVVQGSLNVILDFYILYLPVPVVWNLKMTQKRKLGVLAIFMTGLM